MVALTAPLNDKCSTCGVTRAARRAPAGPHVDSPHDRAREQKKAGITTNKKRGEVSPVKGVVELLLLDWVLVFDSRATRQPSGPFRGNGVGIILRCLPVTTLASPPHPCRRSPRGWGATRGGCRRRENREISAMWFGGPRQGRPCQTLALFSGPDRQAAQCPARPLSRSK